MLHSFTYCLMNLRRNFIAFCNHKLQDIGLTQGQLLFIIYIGKHENSSPKELVEELQLDHGYVARTIMKLVENDFIMKTVNEKDKRAHILKLTQKGKEAFEISYDLFIQRDQVILGDYPEAQQNEIIKLMNVMN